MSNLNGLLTVRVFKFFNFRILRERERERERSIFGLIGKTTFWKDFIFDNIATTWFCLDSKNMSCCTFMPGCILLMIQRSFESMLKRSPFKRSQDILYKIYMTLFRIKGECHFQNALFYNKCTTLKCMFLFVSNLLFSWQQQRPLATVKWSYKVPRSKLCLE